jgi:glycosyltransferase involved in cell wall biosynthesis
VSKTLYLISFYFAPLGRADGVNRAFLTRYLADLGWNVKVICADNPHGLLRNYQIDPSLLDVLGPKVQRFGVPYHAGIRNELACLAHLKPDPFSHWIPAATAEALRQIDAPGVVYAVVPPVSNALVAWQVAKQRNLPLILDFRDNEFRLPRSCVADAAMIAASTQHSLDDMQAHYGRHSNKRRDMVYFNGYPDLEASLTLATTAPKNPLRLIYAGLLNWEQHPAMFSQAANVVRRRRPDLDGRLQLDYYGPHNYYTKLVMRKNRNDSTRFNGYLPFAQVRKELATSSMGISTLVAASKTYCIPSKVFQYIAAGLPIFAVTPPGALSDFVERTGTGIHILPRPRGVIADALEHLLDQPELLQTMRYRVLAQREQFSLRSQVIRLDSSLQELLH